MVAYEVFTGATAINMAFIAGFCLMEVLQAVKPPERTKGTIFPDECPS